MYFRTFWSFDLGFLNYFVRVELAWKIFGMSESQFIKAYLDVLIDNFCEQIFQRDIYRFKSELLDEFG